MADETAVSAPGDGYSMMAWLSMIGAAGVVIFGLYIAYNAPREVGGDAYNYIIGATRGVAVVAAGVGLMVGGAIFALLAAAEKAKTAPAASPAKTFDFSTAREDDLRAVATNPSLTPIQRAYAEKELARRGITV